MSSSPDTTPNTSSAPKVSASPAEPAAQPRASKLRRTDIDGLRGLAIALVVVFHIFVGKVSSGVDIFLLIGGIFFFGSQFRNAMNPQGITVLQALWRILRRLYPALAAVVGATFFLSLLVYSPARWLTGAQDALASLFYLQNYNLASRGQDYAAIDTSVSLYQHLWSMSAQFQIYVASLLVITVLVAITRRHKIARALFFVTLVAATVASFIYASYLHEINQGVNYYSSLSRFWEIGVGGIIGLWLLKWHIPHYLRWVRLPAALIGLALIIGTGVYLDGAAQFPGPLTLIPLAGTVLLIAAGNPVRAKAANDENPAVGTDAPATPNPIKPNLITRLFETSPFQFLGRISYSLYLWHWPLLVIVTYLLADPTMAGNREQGEGANQGMGIIATLGLPLGLAAGTLVIIISVIFAWLTLKLVETPLRQTTPAKRSWSVWRLENHRDTIRLHPLRSALAALIMVFTSATIGGSLVVIRQAADHTTLPNPATISPIDYPGPNALLYGAPTPDVEIVPSPDLSVETMYPETGSDGCTAMYEDEELVLTQHRNTSPQDCAYGDLDSDRTIYVMGSSHAEHLLPGLTEVALRHGIKLVPFFKLGCLLGGEPIRPDGADYPECASWRTDVLDWVIENPPTEGVVLTTTHPGTEMRGIDHVPTGYTAVASELTNAGIHIWGFRDTPWPHRDGTLLDVRLCVADGLYNPEAGEDCGMARDAAYAPVNPALNAYDGLDVTHVDLSDALCTPTRCPGVIGNVLVYRDSSHLTNLYSLMLADEMERQMFP